MRFILLTVLILLRTVAFAVVDTSSFYHLTKESGLPSNHVYSVIKDRSGFIWVATDNGVAKYDGYKFRLFTTNDGLSANDVWKLYEDDNGRIWLFANAFEIGYIKNDRYSAINVGDGNEKIFPAGIVSLGSAVFVLFLKKGIYHVTAVVNNQSVCLPLQNEFTPSRSHLAAMFFSEQQKNAWIFFAGNTAISVDLLHLNATKQVRANENTTAVIAQSGGGLAGKRHFYHFVHRGTQLKVLDIETGRYQTHDLQRMGMGEIITCYFKTDTLHVVSTKGIFGTLGQHLFEIESQYPFSAQPVYYADFGDKWFCTANDGIWVKRKFTALAEDKTIHLPVEDCSLIGAVSDTAYWWNASRNLLKKTYGTRLVDEQVIEGFGKLRSAARGGSEIVYLSNKGVFAQSGEPNDLRRLFKDKRVILTSNNSARATSVVIPDSIVDDLYINDRAVFDISQNSFVIAGNHRTDKFFHSDNVYHVRRLVDDHITGYVKLRSLNRHCFFNSKNIYLFSDNFEQRGHYSRETLEAAGLRSLQEVVPGGGDYYILTANELYKFTPPTKLQRLETGLNLQNARLFITKGKMVVAADFGIAFRSTNAKPEEGFYVLFNDKRLSLGRVTEKWVDSRGVITLVGDQASGTYILDSIEKTPTVLATSKALFHFTANVRRAPLRTTDTIILSGEPHISISPVAQVGSGNYQIYFEHSSPDLVTASGSSIITSALQPNQFYRVRYYLQDDFWRTPVQTLYLKKLPQWYQKFEWKLVFAFAGLLVFTGSIAIAYKTAQQITTKTNERRRVQTELELRAIHSQINPHFIYNTLSAALLFISKQENLKAYEHVSRFSRLLRSYLKSSRERFIILSEEVVMLTRYMELQQAKFEKPFQFEILVRPELQPDHILLPSLLLQPLVENAINHGIATKAEQGYIKVEFFEGHNSKILICTIEDNGIGRTNARQDKRVQQKGSLSYGTALTLDLIEIMKRYESMDIKLEYLDKTHPETGTIVKLTINNIKKLVS
jgi:hypothetical protein